MLRLLKIITPVECVHPLYECYILQPKEGELLYRSATKLPRTVDPSARKWTPWSINIDAPTAGVHTQMFKNRRGFQLLWDAEFI